MNRCSIARALDIESYAHGALGRSMTHPAGELPPAEWMGAHPHSHRAIDDALGFASYLSHLLRMNGNVD